MSMTSEEYEKLKSKVYIRYLEACSGLGISHVELTDAEDACNGVTWIAAATALGARAQRNNAEVLGRKAFFGTLHALLVAPAADVEVGNEISSSCVCAGKSGYCRHIIVTVDGKVPVKVVCTKCHKVHAYSSPK